MMMIFIAVMAGNGAYCQRDGTVMTRCVAKINNKHILAPMIDQWKLVVVRNVLPLCLPLAPLANYSDSSRAS